MPDLYSRNDTFTCRAAHHCHAPNRRMFLKNPPGDPSPACVPGLQPQYHPLNPLALATPSLCAASVTKWCITKCKQRPLESCTLQLQQLFASFASTPHINAETAALSTHITQPAAVSQPKRITMPGPPLTSTHCTHCPGMPGRRPGTRPP